MSRTTLRRGFTLIELLVVIAIIGILISMLLPAVQKVRDAAMRVQCQNNLKQIGVGMHDYHSVKNKFPPPRGSLFPGSNLTFTVYGGWMVDLLPYIDQDPLYKQVRNWPTGYFIYFSRPIKTFQCPADELVSDAAPPGDGAMTSYLGVTGADTDQNAQIFGPTNGIFDLSSTGIRITSIFDGPSYTVMVGERPPAADLYWGWWAVSDYDCLLSAYQLYGMYNNQTFPGIFRAPVYPIDNSIESNHFWSQHSGRGGNWLFGDGSVSFIEYVASDAILRLATRDGDDPVSTDDY
jgi:prepilin-type N-terminal cleavage/methylation domain-containing protein/prepilin-type processing-associated H-X9-DG protein